MPKFALLVSYSAQYWAALVEHPTDREAAVREVIESAGGSLLSFDFMFGQYDGLVVAEFPSSADAAATSIAVGSSGVIAELETHELIPPSDLPKILEKAKKVKAVYHPPTD